MRHSLSDNPFSSSGIKVLLVIVGIFFSCSCSTTSKPYDEGNYSKGFFHGKGYGDHEKKNEDKEISKEKDHGSHADTSHGKK